MRRMPAFQSIFYIASLCDFQRIIERLMIIRKKLSHLCGTFWNSPSGNHPSGCLLFYPCLTRTGIMCSWSSSAGNAHHLSRRFPPDFVRQLNHDFAILESSPLWLEFDEVSFRPENFKIPFRYRCAASYRRRHLHRQLTLRHAEITHTSLSSDSIAYQSWPVIKSLT